jgi:hypothetical protein
MPKLIHATPKYRHHKTSGQAIVSIGGTDVYLGPWKSKASRVEYDRVISEWLAAGRQPRKTSDDDAVITVAELIVIYMRHVRS